MTFPQNDKLKNKTKTDIKKDCSNGSRKIRQVLCTHHATLNNT